MLLATAGIHRQPLWVWCNFGLEYHLSISPTLELKPTLNATLIPFASPQHLSGEGQSPVSPCWFITLERRPLHISALVTTPQFVQSHHWVSAKPHVGKGFTTVASCTSQTTSTTPALQKEPAGMEEKLSVVFQVSKFKYVILSDSFNYYSFNRATREAKKKDLSPKIVLRRAGGGQRNSRMFYLWENCKLP